LKRYAKENPDAFSLEAQRKLSALDDHHLFPDQFDFRALGIFPDEYNMLLDAGWHRLLHMYWNPLWGQFPWHRKPGAEEAFEYLRKMMKDTPHLRP
jgi:hypothetical protein